MSASPYEESMQHFDVRDEIKKLGLLLDDEGMYSGGGLRTYTLEKLAMMLAGRPISLDAENAAAFQPLEEWAGEVAMSLWVVGESGESYPAGETQVESFERTKETRETKREKVLEVIRNAGREGLCVAEVAEALGWEQHWASPRIHELKRGNDPLVKDSGRTRWNAKSRRFQAVWVAV